MTKLSRPVSDSSPYTGLCVVIPARNEKMLIARCVSSVIAAGIQPADIFVIDDASTDGMGDVLRQMADVNVLRNLANRGKAGSVRHAIEHYGLVGRYAFLALLDADSHVCRDYFNVVAQTFDADPRAVLVCGSPRGEAHNYLTAFRTLDYYAALLMYRQGQDSIGVITVAPGCASTYRTSILPELDWDGGTLVEDMDLTLQIHRKRLGRVRYARRAVVHTQDPRRLREYIGQLTRWYSGTWQVMRVHRLPFGRQAIDAEFALLVGEGLFYAMLALAMPVLLWLRPSAALTWIALDQGVFAVTALTCAIHLRRADVVAWFPVFLILRWIGCTIWLRTFWLEVVRRQTLRTWFSVGRYDTNDRSGHRHAEVSCVD
jgi:poly-beta-1,6-N-acetyl-D-glucosamine synthase